MMCGGWPIQSLSSEACMRCHENPSLRKMVEQESIPLFVDYEQIRTSVHSAVNCVDCHRGLDGGRIPHAEIITPVQCQTCHVMEGFDASVHRKLLKTNDHDNRTVVTGCTGCHGTHTIRSSGDPKSASNRSNLTDTCGDCHVEVSLAFQGSAHSMGIARGMERSPSCIDCHGVHDVIPLDNSESPLFRIREPEQCLSCHLHDETVREATGASYDFMAGYRRSVHGIELAAGNLRAANCNDCHGSHDMNYVNDPASSVSRMNIADTCAHCHPEISSIYNESVHGKSVREGNHDAPTCADCHGQHLITSTRDPISPTVGVNVTEEICATCHDSVRITDTYAIASDRFRTFYDSRHGLALRAGRVEAINCASCHGIHNIKPSSDPDSSIHSSNIAATCGGCHPGANENFARGTIHMPPAHDPESGILYWIRGVYLFLIVVVIGGMLFHNLFDFIRKSRHRLAVQQGKIIPGNHGTGHHIRMRPGERIQHAVMMISFTLLAVTGFMVRYPDSWWVLPFRQMSENFYELRGVLHKSAAAAMVAVSLWHLLWLFTTDRGKQFLVDMKPSRKDIVDGWRNLLYLMGLSKIKPLFGRFRYIEKIEYWSLVWGVVIMSASGVIMWFHNYFMGVVTKLGMDMARTVHFYEACLAVLAIIVWHFYFVVVNPSVYPMNTAWITGRISESEMAEEHPLELERLKNRE
jgi:cytochrome b subunit of formate dehydrogenase